MGSLSSLEILLVEDRERVRKAIQALLKKIGYLYYRINVIPISVPTLKLKYISP